MRRDVKPTVNAKPFLTLDLFQVSVGRDAGLYLVGEGSRTGESVLDGAWLAPHGRVDSDQLEDLIAVVDDLVRDCVITFCGVQEVLELP